MGDDTLQSALHIGIIGDNVVQSAPHRVVKEKETIPNAERVVLIREISKDTHIIHTL